MYGLTHTRTHTKVLHCKCQQNDDKIYENK